MKNWPLSGKFFVTMCTTFFLFMMAFFYQVYFAREYLATPKRIQSLFFAFLMAVPYEKPVDGLQDIIDTTDRAHFCKGI